MTTFREVHALLRQHEAVAALVRIMALHSLNTSFGSKHLKSSPPTALWSWMA
ncbi:hypothetical protein ACFQY5_36045 [Paeniroseomonas aquatica]|uniref:hypothetical protein n=1 Tax=Paeniroseomonas aquatica TaxID=373043 RepID=UPI0036188CE3